MRKKESVEQQAEVIYANEVSDYKESMAAEADCFIINLMT